MLLCWSTLYRSLFQRIEKSVEKKRQCKTRLSQLLLQAENGSIKLEQIQSAVQDSRKAARHLKHCQKNAAPLRDQLYSEIAKDTMKMFPERRRKNYLLLSSSEIVKNLGLFRKKYDLPPKDIVRELSHMY